MLHTIRPELIPTMGITSEAALKAEVTRLGLVVDSIVRELEGAEYSSVSGEVHPGRNRKVLPTFIVKTKNIMRGTTNTFKAIMGTCSVNGNEITVNIGRWTDWSDIVETIVHEVCHRYRPWDETHSKEFWALLDRALRECYGVAIPLQRLPKGAGQSFRDHVATVLLRHRFLWAKRMPMIEIEHFMGEGPTSYYLAQFSNEYVVEAKEVFDVSLLKVNINDEEVRVFLSDVVEEQVLGI